VETPELYAAHLRRHGFTLREVIGTGLSGHVFRAEQISLQREVAIKFFDNPSAQNNPGLRTRFEREGNLLAKVQHPNVPFVITRGRVPRDGGLDVPYLVLEYVRGTVLEELLEHHPSVDSRKAVNYVRQVLDALACAHHQHVIHRDVKPSNIIVADDHCYLIDFSIGVDLDETGAFRATRTGGRLGTYDYAAPEQQVNARHVDHRADLYSCGVLLLELLTGQRQVRNINSAMTHVNRDLREVVRKACALECQDRYQSAGEFERALRHFDELRLGHLLAPGLAICTNLHCSGAVWSEQGYYRGPRFIEDCEYEFCDNCGAELKRVCDRCGARPTRKPYCGNCGNQLYSLPPECEQCGSYLRKVDMGQDTRQFGCEKCRKDRRREQIPFSDDDIPF
jgi:serine/threonine-protein kinase